LTVASDLIFLVEERLPIKVRLKNKNPLEAPPNSVK